MRNKWAIRKRQFGALYRVFLMRVVDLEMLSADADTTRLVGQFATVFASLSLLFTLPLLLAAPAMVVKGGAASPSTVMWRPEHFFIATTMAVAGIMSVLTWDSAFLDRRDVLVLAPLPIRMNALFLAKIAALFAAPALAILSLNVFSGMLWPALFMSPNGNILHMMRAWPAYWFTVAAAGVFMFCSALTLQGVAANLLPRQLYLRLSAVLQAALLSIVLVSYFLEPSLESVASLTAGANQRTLAWLPSYWFLGMFQQVNGSMLPAMVPLARRAWMGLGVSVLGAGVALLLSYFRMVPMVVEQPDIAPSRRGRLWSPDFGGSLKSTIVLFAMRTLLRSRQHRMILSFYFGFGVTVLMGYIDISSGAHRHAAPGGGVTFLVASTLLMILTLLALRVVATIPITLQANWIFRTTQVRPPRAYWAAVRTMFVTLGVAPVWLISAAFCGVYPWRPMVGHQLALLCLGMLLVELCLYRFRKIPFACSYLPGNANIHFMFWGCLAFFILLLDQAARIESLILGHFLSSALLILCIAIVAGGVRWLNHALANPADELLIEEEYPPIMITLNLSSRARR